MSKWIVLCRCIAMGLVAGAIGAWFTAASVRSWYPTLLKPADTPPSWVFGPVWSTLYVLMGTAAWFIWQQRSAEDATVALAFFFDQLLLNATWSFMFFDLQQPKLALIEIVALPFVQDAESARHGKFPQAARHLASSRLVAAGCSRAVLLGSWLVQFR